MQNPPPIRIRHPLSWVPSAYFAEGIPFAMVIWVAGTLFKDLGRGDAEITLATGSIAIAWSLKPFWAAALDMFKSKKYFVLACEYGLAALLVLCAIAVRTPNYFVTMIALLWAIAFTSATQDICIDGVYITSLDSKNQAGYIGVQGMAWNVGRIFATAVVVWLAGWFKEDFGMPAQVAWSNSLLVAAGTMALLAVYHTVVLPLGSSPSPPENLREATLTFIDTVKDFFRKPQLLGMLMFVFLYRSGEGFLLVEAPLFLQGSLESGGLGLTLKEKGLIDGTVSTVISMVGGLLGGMFIAKRGLPKALFWMALAMNIPHLCYVLLSQQVSPGHPLSLTTIATLVTIEKAGYSFGFVANMLYMMQQITPGKYPMTHYAFCTALMNLVLVPTQALSGPLAHWLGYRSFFLFVLVASIPSLIAAWYAPFPHRSDATPGSSTPA